MRAPGSWPLTSTGRTAGEKEGAFGARPPAQCGPWGPRCCSEPTFQPLPLCLSRSGGSTPSLVGSCCLSSLLRAVGVPLAPASYPLKPSGSPWGTHLCPHARLGLVPGTGPQPWMRQLLRGGLVGAYRPAGTSPMVSLGISPQEAAPSAVHFAERETGLEGGSGCPRRPRREGGSKDVRQDWLTQPWLSCHLVWLSCPVSSIAQTRPGR